MRSKKEKGLLLLIVIASFLFILYGNYVNQAKKTGTYFGGEENLTGNLTKNHIKDQTEQKRIAITFDDGPHPYYTEQLLEGLKERNVKATFFLLGESASLYPEIVEKIAEDGHLIGNHTYSHIQLTQSNQEKFLQEIKETNQILTDITGQDICFVRPPYGSWDKDFEKELNMLPILWNIDPNDWCATCSKTIVENVVTKAKDNGIILLHDCYKTTVTAALKIIDILQDKGYEFVTADQILLE